MKNNTLWLLDYGALGWDDNEKDAEDIDRKVTSEGMLMAILNYHQYFSQNGNNPQRINKTSKALKLHRHTIERIVKRGFAQKSKREENLKRKKNYLELIITGKASFVRRFVASTVKLLL